MTKTAVEVTRLIAEIATALNRLEALDINVQMPATFNAGGMRTDAGTLTFEHYDGPRPIAEITWNGSQWQTTAPAGCGVAEGDERD